MKFLNERGLQSVVGSEPTFDSVASRRERLAIMN